MFTRILALLFVFVFVPSCAAFASVFSQVISAVVDAIPIVEQIAQWADRHFAAAPDSAAQASLDAKLNRYRSCLTGVERAVNTYGEGLELDAAKADCTKAWADLSSSLTGLKGVKNMPKVGQPGSVSVVDEKTGEALVVPEPTAGAWQ